MADDRHGVHLGRKFHRSWFDCEPDCRAKGGRARGRNQLLGLFPGRRAADCHHACDRHAMAVAVTSATNDRGFQPRSLDAINFLLADVRGAVGPYLNVFLVTQQHWSQSEVGLVTTVSGLLGISVQTPIGAAIDATRAKREVIVLALAVLAIGATVIFAVPSF